MNTPNPYTILWGQMTRKERVKIVKRALKAKVSNLDILKQDYPELNK